MILSGLRALFPQTSSLLMDAPTLQTWRDRIAVDGSGANYAVPVNLTDSEKHAFMLCREHDLRIEQERLSQATLHDALGHVAEGGECEMPG